MTIVAYGYGLAGAAVIANFLVDDIILLALTDEPDITLDPDITVTLDADVDIALDADIDIEVEG